MQGKYFHTIIIKTYLDNTLLIYQIINTSGVATCNYQILKFTNAKRIIVVYKCSW